MNYFELGIVGGMGSKATAIFFDKLVERTEATCDQEHISTIILNHASLPDRTTAILSGEHDTFLSAIEKDFALLSMIKPKAIAIPCNTSHYFYDDLKRMTDIPIINMIEETIFKCVATYGIQKPMVLLATDGTVQSGVYEKYAKANGLTVKRPDEEVQAFIMKTIYQDVKSGDPVDIKRLSKVIMNYVNREGCSGVILGCTELSTIDFNATVSKYCIDAMDVLVETAIERSDHQLKY